LKILEPSGSLGNIKPVADRWTAESGIKIEYVEVPLEEISQKVLLEAVSRTGSFDLALPASFGIPDPTSRVGPLMALENARKCWVSEPAFDFVVLNELDVRFAVA